MHFEASHLKEHFESQHLTVVSMKQGSGFSAIECPKCNTGAFYQGWEIVFSESGQADTPITGAAIIMNNELGQGMMGPLKGTFEEAAILLLSTICKKCNTINIPGDYLLSEG